MSIYKRLGKPYKLVRWEGYFYVVPRWWTKQQMKEEDKCKG